MASPVSSMDELPLITFSLQSCPTSQTPKPGVSHTRLTERGQTELYGGRVQFLVTPKAHQCRGRMPDERLGRGQGQCLFALVLDQMHGSLVRALKAPSRDRSPTRSLAN